MIYGYANNIVELPQISLNSLQEPQWAPFLEHCGLSYQSAGIDKIFVRENNHRMLLFHTKSNINLLNILYDLTTDMHSDLLYLNQLENELLDLTKPGDIIVTSTLLNFSRYFEQAIKVVRFFYEKNVRVISLMEEFDSFEPQLLMESTVYFKFQESRAIDARFVRLKREKEKGIQKKTTWKRGPNALTIKDFPDFEFYYKQWKARSITQGAFAKNLSISVNTLKRLVKDYEQPTPTEDQSNDHVTEKH